MIWTMVNDGYTGRRKGGGGLFRKFPVPIRQRNNESTNALCCSDSLDCFLPEHNKSYECTSCDALYIM